MTRQRGRPASPHAQAQRDLEIALAFWEHRTLGRTGYAVHAAPSTVAGALERVTRRIAAGEIRIVVVGDAGRDRGAAGASQTNECLL